MEQKEYQGKSYNYAPATERCPQITIKGKPFCVLKSCYYRAIGAACPPEAPENWEQMADFLVMISRSGGKKPEEWI